MLSPSAAGGGGASLADSVTCFGRKIHRYFWFMLSGMLCDVVQFGIDGVIYNIYPERPERATVCWTLSYTASIIVRHGSHRVIVFGEYDGTYWSSLCRTYLTYLASIILSMVTNYILTSILNVPHLYAWVATMLWTGVFNYFMLKASWRQGGANTPVSTSAAAAGAGNGSGSVESIINSPSSIMEDGIALLPKDRFKEAKE